MNCRALSRSCATLPATLLIASSLTAQQPPVFRSTSTGVSFFVGVEDGGHPVTGLTAADFIVLDNRVRQNIGSFSAVDQLNLTVALDVSESIGRDPLAEFQRAALFVITALDEQDSSALVTFGDRVFSHNSLMSGAEPTRRGIAEATRRPGARTALWDAVLVGAGITASGTGRPVLVVATDGCDNASWTTPSLVGRWLGRTDVTVDFLWFGSSRTAREPRLNFHTGDYDCPGPLGLVEASSLTGGLVYQTDQKNLAVTLSRRILALRSGYQIIYVPEGVRVGDGWHGLEVRLRSGVRGRTSARSGYFSGPPAK